MRTLLNVISNCKEDLVSYSITLNSLKDIRDNIRLISVIKCRLNDIEDFKREAEPFKNKKLIFNSDIGLYNAINIGINQIDKQLPFICLHSGDLLFDKNKKFLCNLLSKPMPKYSLYLFNTYVFNFNDQNLEDLKRKNKNSNYIKNLMKREPSNVFLRKIYLFFTYHIHQSIVYSPEMYSLRFNEDVGLVADLLYNHNAYKISKRIIRFDKFLSIFNKNGLSSMSLNKEKLKSRFLILSKYPFIIFDQRFLKGLIAIILKNIFSNN